MNAGLNELSAAEFDVYNDILSEISRYTKNIKESVINDYLKLSSWTKVESHCYWIRKILNRKSYVKIARQIRLYLMIIK
jgi:hypothetical protein